MRSFNDEYSWSARARSSLERSHRRRELSRRLRRRALRVRASGASVLAVTALVAVAGTGAAVGQSVTGSGLSASGAVAQGLLVRGSQGSAVAAVQRRLGVHATGVFGRRTDRAVRRFQRRKGLVVDGVVGPHTRAALGLGGSASARSRGSAAPAAPAAPSGELQKIAQCESGGNPGAVGGNGLYRGKYQMTLSTWRSVGGSGDPAAAPEAEQDRRAARLLRRSGTSQWPNCG